MKIFHVLPALGAAASIMILPACEELESQTVNSASAATTLHKFDGDWTVIGATDAPPEGNIEGTCAYGTGNGVLHIAGAKISGEVMDNSGYEYSVEGIIDEQGNMSGKMTYAGYDAADLKASFNQMEGNGSWMDPYSCPGSWKAAREDASAPKPEAAPEAASLAGTNG